jgi:hypothetical protein
MNVPVLVVDGVVKLPPEANGAIVIGGSNDTIYAAYFSGPNPRLKHRLTPGLCGGSIISLCSVTSEFSSYAISIDIHLLDPDGARSMAEFKECRLEWSWILIGTLGGGGRDSESAQAS